MSLDTLTQKNNDDSSREEMPRPRRRSLAWLLPVALLLGFVTILLLLFGDRLRSAVSVKTAPVVTIRAAESTAAKQEMPVGKGKLLFQASGWVEPDPYITFVPTLTNGVIDKVEVLEGQAVKKGDLLATLIDEDAKLDLREAGRKYISLEKKIVAHCAGFEVIDAEVTASQRKVDSIKTQLKDARDHLDRLSGLSEGAVSRQKVVQARLAYERQVAMLAEAEAAIPRLQAQQTRLTSEKESMLAKLDELETVRDRAQLALDRTKIFSPMDGVVLHLHVAPGKKRMLDMESEKSAVIVELFDPQELQARIDVPLNEAAALRVGQAVEMVSDLLPDTTFSGRVTRITGQADLQRNTLQAKVKIENPDERLRPEMLVRAKFFGSGNNVKSAAGSSVGRFSLYVPIEALVNESTVWVVSPDSLAEKREIETGDEVREGHRLVVDGLRSGESVILPPHDQISEGVRVNPNNSTK